MKPLFRRLNWRRTRRGGRIWRVAKDGVHVELDRNDGQLEIVTVPRDKVAMTRRWTLRRKESTHEHLSEGLAVEVVTDKSGTYKIEARP